MWHGLGPYLRSLRPNLRTWPTSAETPLLVKKLEQSMSKEGASKLFQNMGSLVDLGHLCVKKDVLKLPDQSNNIYFCIQWHWNPCTAYTICNGMFALGTKTFFSYVNGENLIWKFFTMLLIRLLYRNIVKNEPTFSECQTILVLNWNTVVSHRNESFSQKWEVPTIAPTLPL